MDNRYDLFIKCKNCSNYFYKHILKNHYETEIPYACPKCGTSGMLARGIDFDVSK